MLGNINSQQVYSSLYIHLSYDLETTTVSGENKGHGSSGVMDKISLQGESTFALTYSSSLLAKVDEDAAYRKLQDLVTNLLKEQSIATTVDTGDGEIDLTNLTPGDAQKLAADDGYFSVEKHRTGSLILRCPLQAGIRPGLMPSGKVLTGALTKPCKPLVAGSRTFPSTPTMQ